MKPFVADPDFALYVGDVREVLRELPDESAHCCVTSPPYWGLRDYGVPGQLGLERTPGEYVEAMVSVFREVHRVLRSDGTLWLNLGDSYNAYNGGAGPGSALSKTQTQARPQLDSGFGLRSKELKPKDLVGIPWRVALGLQEDGWYLRSDIIWSKPNPMPESIKDRPTKAHEYVFLLSKAPRYFYDPEPLRTALLPATVDRGRYGHSSWAVGQFAGSPTDSRFQAGKSVERCADIYNPAGANARTVWEIATQPYAEAHFAVYPEELARRCIAAGTSEGGCCSQCGAPRDRLTAHTSLDRSDLPRDHPEWRPRRYDDGKAGDPQSPGPGQRFTSVETTGWKSACAHSGPLGSCVVLDPFMGSGTTALVARRLGRKSVGVELNPEYADLAARRLQQLSLLAEDVA